MPVKIFPDDLNDGYYIRSSFNRQFIDGLKSLINPPFRTWIPESKVWWFDSIFLEDVISLAQKCYGSRIDVLRIATDDVPEDYRTLFLLPGAPPELIKSAYRILAKLNHPDVGGDTKTMQRINLAYERLTK